MADPENDLPIEPFQDGPLPSCSRCGNNGLRTRQWRHWRIMHCGHCGHGWRERVRTTCEVRLQQESSATRLTPICGKPAQGKMPDGTPACGIHLRSKSALADHAAVEVGPISDSFDIEDEIDAVAQNAQWLRDHGLTELGAPPAVLDQREPEL